MPDDATINGSVSDLLARKQQLNDIGGPIEAELRRAAAHPGEVNEDALKLLNASRADVRAQLEAIERGLARHAAIDQAAGNPGATVPGDGFQHQRQVDPWDDRHALRDRAMALVARSGISGSGGEHLTDDQRARATALLRASDENLNGEYIAARTLITENPDYRSAWRQVMTNPTPVLTDNEARALRRLGDLERAMSIGTPSAGGYGVPVLIDPTIVMTGQGSLNPFMEISRVEQITTDRWKGVSSAGVTWSYDAEGATVSDDTPTLAQPEVVTHMARGFVPFSIEVGMDYPDFAENMARLLAEGHAELNAQMFATGSGSGQPFGILTNLDANAAVEVTPTTDGAFGGVDVNKVWGALPDRYKANATWMMSHDVGNEVATFGNGNNLSFVTVDLTGVVTSLRQRPVAFSSYFPEFVGTTGAANILVVGDFRNYLIAIRAGLTTELIPHLFDTTSNRPTASRGWFAWARTGSRSINDQAWRLLQNA